MFGRHIIALTFESPRQDFAFMYAGFYTFANNFGEAYTCTCSLYA